MSDAGRRIVITDSRLPDIPAGPSVLRWSGYDESDGSVSIPVYLDAHGDRLRARYLALIHDLGATPVRGRSPAQHFTTARGFNLWHMGLLAEKSPFKSARVVDSVKLLALEELLVSRVPTSVLIEGVDGVIATAIEGLCRNLGIEARRGKLRAAAGGSRLRKVPHPLRALLHLVHYLRERWPLRRVRRGWLTSPNTVSFFSYFFNIDRGEFAAGRFHSPQWGPFPSFLAGHGVAGNWVHHLVPRGAVPDAATALQWIGRFNQASPAAGRHVFVDAELTAGVVVRALASYLGLAWRARRFRGALRAATAPQSRAPLWPLLREDWRASTRGWPALQATLWIELFDAALAAMPRQATGFYLQENQGWERALIHSWRRHGHGTLVAVAHSTVRFWDLRYFDDPRTWARVHEAGGQPQPDLVAVNGPHARDMMQSAGFPSEKLVDVEALRYLHLAPGAVEAERVRTAPDTTRPLRLLVAGDSMREPTVEVLRTLAEALAVCDRRIELRFKPHPFTPIDLRQFPLPAVEECTAPIGELMGDADVVLGSISSAMVEAYCLGVQPLIFLGRDTVNFSPLVGLEDVLVARNALELAAALTAARGGGGTRRRAYFHLDPRLPKWRELLRRLRIETAA